jgi:hypothetical protein
LVFLGMNTYRSGNSLRRTISDSPATGLHREMDHLDDGASDGHDVVPLTHECAAARGLPLQPIGKKPFRAGAALGLSRRGGRKPLKPGPFGAKIS